MWFIGPLILFGIYGVPFIALLLPLLSFYRKTPFYCYAAATLSLSFAFWFGIGGNLHHAAAVPVLLFMTGFALHHSKVSFAWILYAAQAAIVVSVLLMSAYYGFATRVEVAPSMRTPMTPQ